MKRKLNSSSPQLCQICGDIARGVNFFAVSCMSCKMFFRRRALLPVLKQMCPTDGKCRINRKTRKFCATCRLKRCFAVGMDPLLIRHTSSQRHPIPKSPKLRSLGLRERDYSTLTTNEWSFLSNLINSYDEQDFFRKNQAFLDYQCSLPLKVRTKTCTVLSHLTSLFQSSQAFIARCPLLSSLPAPFRQALLKRNCHLVAIFNAFYIAREMCFFENDIYSKFIDSICGENHSKSVVPFSRRLEPNAILIKIFLVLMAFSSNSGLVCFEHAEAVQVILNPTTLLQLEDVVVTILWKYSIHQYGYHGAIVRVASLVKSLLDLMISLEESLNKGNHWTIIEKTTYGVPDQST